MRAFFSFLAEISSARLDRFEIRVRGSRFEFRIRVYFKGFVFSLRAATSTRNKNSLATETRFVSLSSWPGQASVRWHREREWESEQERERERRIVGWQSERVGERQTGLWESNKNFCYINDNFSSPELT